MSTETKMTPLEIAENYEGPGEKQTPDGHPVIWVNAEDYATILAELRRLSDVNADLLATCNRVIEMTRGIICHSREDQDRLDEAREILIRSAVKAKGTP